MTNYENQSWYVHKHKIRVDYPVIENLKQFLAPLPPILPKYHPDYIKYWSKETKKCIEGIWRQEFGKWRYMPGNLYFFGSFTVLENTEEIDGVKVTKHFKPYVPDYYWEFAAQSWTAYGFSGFERDSQFTCHEHVKLYNENKFPRESLPSTCIKPNGDVKEYIPAFEYLLKLHDQKLGRSLFQNEAKDTITFGSRRGGKSFFVALGELEYNFVFGGARRYDQDFIDGKYASRQLVGSADTTKSGDLLDKFEKSQAAKLDNKNNDFVKWFGIYTEVEIDSKGNNIEKVTPCPFYKKSSGNLQCPNKLNPYRAKYKVEKNGEWIEEGTGSEIVHVNYSTKKADGFTAGVGGAYLFADMEEIGLLGNATAVKGANDAATKRNGIKFGVQHGQGTSGSIDHVQEAKKLFLNPDDYQILSYSNVFSTQGANNRIGYFLPNYIIHFDCKDENGNTDYDKVIDKINRKRIEKANSKDPKVLRDFIMNEPVYVPEMWITDHGYYLPYEEFSEREKELSHNQLFRTEQHRKCVDLIWNSDNTVNYKIKHSSDPIDTFPIPKNKKDRNGEIVIYEFPEPNAPADLYFYTCDPYVEDDIELGGSLAVTHVWKNPKYSAIGFDGDILVAEYVAKPDKGLDYYYSNQEKLIALYGNTPQGLWYDARGGGETLRSYYIGRGKQYLLCLRPGIAKGQSVQDTNITTHGIVIGNLDSKKTALKMAYDWCKTITTDKWGITKMNVFRLPSMFLVQQAIDYNLKDNFDAVSSFYFMPIALREMTVREELRRQSETTVDIFQKLKSNNKIFRNAQNIKG